MKQLRVFLFILAVGVFGILNTEMGVIGILPAISEAFGVTVSKAGLLVSLFALVVAGAGPTMPLLFSRFNRKYVMLFALAVFVIANLISAFTTSFDVLLAARIIPAFFHPVYCSLAFAAAADAAPPGEGPDAVGKVMIGTAAGMVVGVPVSNFLASAFSLEASLVFSAAVTALAFVATVFWIPSMPVAHAPGYGSQLSVLKKPVVWQALLAVVFMNGSVFGVFSYLADYLGRVTMLDGAMVSALLFVYGIANVIGSYFSGRIIIRWPVSSVQAFPFVILAIYAVMLFAGHSAILMPALILFWGIAGGVNANMNQYWLTTAAPEAKAFANGLFLTAANIGTMAASMFCGFLIDRAGTASIVWGGMAFAVISAFCIFWRTANSESRFALLQGGVVNENE